MNSWKSTAGKRRGTDLLVVHWYNRRSPHSYVQSFKKQLPQLPNTMDQPNDAPGANEYDAEDLVRYFDAQVEEPAQAEYVLGAKHVREWRAMRLRDDVTQPEFDEFMTRVEATETAGSAYAHLWVTIRNWGYLLGFTVPRLPPPRLTGYDNATICMSNAGFETEVTVGKTYDVLELDNERFRVRIANDQEEQGWYACSHFQFPNIPEREFVQQPDW